MIELSKIRTNGGTQARAEIQEQTVSEYAEAMGEQEADFPPIIVYYDGQEYWLADGFHRVAAWQRIGQVEVPADVRQGTRRDAILHSVAANAVHGLRRSNADKRRAVMTLLEDEEWSRWNDSKIARQCAVDHKTVARLRPDHLGNSQDGSNDRVRTVERNGTTYQQDTSNIGKAQPNEAPAKEQTATAEKAPEVDTSDAAYGDESDVETEPPADPYGYAKLTADALLDTVNGLRADLDDARAEVKALKAERDDYKTKWKEATDESDIGRKLGNAQRARDTAKGRISEEQAKNARQTRRIKALEAEVKTLTAKLERQEVEI